MTEIENSGSLKTASVKTSWFRRAVLGTAFAAVGVLTLGAATTPAQAYWYGYGPYPYYASYPYNYGWYGNPAYYGGWGYGWRGGWGWRHGYYRHW
jgi:hypothetical protein